MADAGNHRIWVPNATGIAGTPPGTIYGIPVILSERSVALGTRGDLVLADLSYYLVKPGSGPFVATSPHVYFTTNRTVIKIFWLVDGQPWLAEPIQLEGAAVGNTISPFVVLQ
jgi:HK97 family phage major capsid protein